MINSSNSQQNLHSNRGGIPTAPGSHRSNKQLSSRRQYPINEQSARGGNVSQRGQQISGRNSSSRHPQPSDSKRSIQGGIIDGEYLVNPVFLGAVYQTSRFDKALEDDYEGADQTLTVSVLALFNMI